MLVAGALARAWHAAVTLWMTTRGITAKECAEESLKRKARRTRGREGTERLAV